MSDPMMSRRLFLGSAAAAGGVLMAPGFMSGPALAATAAENLQLPPVKIYKIFIGRTGGYMARPKEEIQQLNDRLAGLEKKLGNVQFLGGEVIPTVNVDQVAEKARAADAILIVYLSAHGGDAPIINKLIGLGLPTALFFQPFGGHGWMYFHEWKKAGNKLMLMSTSDWSELDRTVALLRVPAWMKQSRILVVGTGKGTKSAITAETVKKKLGAELVPIKNEQILEAMKSIDAKAAEAEAEQYWIGQARKIVEPTRDKIIESARMYLAVRAMMKEQRAQAITSSHCMGNPRCCLTFSKLNDQGCVGACEGDVDSTLTMLVFAYAFGAPGFISDPVVDTSKNALIHFHCTSCTKMAGPGSKRMPFTMRDQTDTKGGVALEVQYPLGQAVTCAKLINLDTMLCSTGEIIGTSTDPNACRTQFTTKVKNAQSMFLNWGGGVLSGQVNDTMTMLHRVVFFGDHYQGVSQLADLMGYKVVEEGA